MPADLAVDAWSIGGAVAGLLLALLLIRLGRRRRRTNPMLMIQNVRSWPGYR